MVLYSSETSTKASLAIFLASLYPNFIITKYISINYKKGGYEFGQDSHSFHHSSLLLVVQF